MQCPKCQGDMKIIPAGVSKKTGKPYEAFYSCKTWECGGTAKIPTEGQPTSQGSFRPDYSSFPKKEIKTTMDYKAKQISGFQDEKQESMRLFSSGRDATLMMTSGVYVLTDEEKKDKLLEWRDWFYTKVYNMTEAEYKNLNSPF